MGPEHNETLVAVRSTRQVAAQPVAFDPEAKAPTWEAFLNDIFMRNAAVVAYVQRAIGYSVTGSNAEQALFFEHGAGDNGKMGPPATVGSTPTGLPASHDPLQMAPFQDAALGGDARRVSRGRPRSF